MKARVQRHFYIDSTEKVKRQLFCWAKQFKTVAWLETNNYPQEYTRFELGLAIDELTSIRTDFHDAFEKLATYQSAIKDYIFGYIGYDVKNDIENLSSKNFDGLAFTDLYFFQPKKLIFIKQDQIEFHYIPMLAKDIDADFNIIVNHPETLKDAQNGKTTSKINIKSRISEQAYFQKVNKILDHIHKGNIYEVNFCQEFYADNTTINPYEVYAHLNKISSPPFASFFKTAHQYLLSASPERYLTKQGENIISQPIKGTAKRLPDKTADQKVAINLALDPKERAENTMIVDLVRNDLSKIAKKGSVQVVDFCKVHTFKQVHQLISTISAKVSKETPVVEIIKSTFPMGSMTGTPKITAMQIIEELEETKRSLYSGTVGYFSPNGDCDFNVIIRSILYNPTKKYVSYSVGGAITAKSTPEKEYEECLLKAKAMKWVLLNSI